MRQLDREFGAMDVREIIAWHTKRSKARRKEESEVSWKERVGSMPGKKVSPAGANPELAPLMYMCSMAFKWGKEEGTQQMMRGETFQ